MNINVLKVIFFLSFFSLDEFSHLEKFESILLLLFHSSSQQSTDLDSHLKIRVADLFFSNMQTLPISRVDLSLWYIKKTSLIINLMISKCDSNNLYQLLIFTY